MNNSRKKYSGFYSYVPDIEKISGEKEIIVYISDNRIIRFDFHLKNCEVSFCDIDTLSDYIITGENNTVIFDNVSGESSILIDSEVNFVTYD